MFWNVSTNFNKCYRMLINVAKCWIEMLDQNVIKNVVECWGIITKCCTMLLKCCTKCWRMLENIMLSNVILILRECYQMLSNVEKCCSKMLTNVGEYNVIKCDHNFKRMLSNVEECQKMLENVIKCIKNIFWHKWDRRQCH